MLDVVELDFDFQDAPLLNKLSFQLREGDFLHLKGPNGAGKTTLLKVIAGVYQPLHGQIVFRGLPVGEQLRHYQEQICYIGHQSGLNPNLTVRENCFFDLHHRTPDHQISELVKVFHLDAQLDQRCAVLSAGQTRQVSLLRLWMTTAKLWLLDEPLVALDGAAIVVLMKQIAQHRKQGGAVLLTSHQNIPLAQHEYKVFQL